MTVLELVTRLKAIPTTANVYVTEETEAVSHRITQVTVSYNLASHAINKHLDLAAAAYDDWKKVQEGDVIRNADVLKQQLVDTITVQNTRLQALQAQQKQIEANLEFLGRAETSASLDFSNQLSTAKLLLQIEIGDATFRLDQLKEFLARNF